MLQEHLTPMTVNAFIALLLEQLLLDGIVS